MLAADHRRMFLQALFHPTNKLFQRKKLSMRRRLDILPRNSRKNVTSKTQTRHVSIWARIPRSGIDIFSTDSAIHQTSQGLDE